MTDWYRINKGFIWVREPKIPAEYQEVEYIQSSWTQYIDTLYILKRTDVVECSFTWTATDTFQVIFWSRSWTWDSKHYSLWFRDLTSTSYVQYDVWWYIQPTLSNFDLSSPWIYKIEAWQWFYNGVSMWTWTANYTTPTITCYIFWRNNNWTLNSPWSIKLYYLKIFDNWKLVRDLIPCYRKSDNVIWLYDLVDDQFYTNSWTWTFIKGNDATTYVFKEKQFYSG